MGDDSTKQSVLFAELFGRPLTASFDEPLASSDGGAVLLAAADRRLDLCRRMADCLTDSRQPGKVRHAMVDLVRERVFGIACGYPDANDAGRLGEDPIHKLLLGRDPVAGQALASQPTLSRFEHAAKRPDLLRQGQELAAIVIERHRKRLRGRARVPPARAPEPPTVAVAVPQSTAAGRSCVSSHPASTLNRRIPLASCSRCPVRHRALALHTRTSTVPSRRNSIRRSPPFASAHFPTTAELVTANDWVPSVVEDFEPSQLERVAERPIDQAARRNSRRTI